MAGRPGGSQTLRIIGGRHRGRKLRFPDSPGLRPTADRVRETLFNWLQPVLAGARCLDLFAGSGALGLEALSRGAGRVLMLEKSDRAAHQLRENLQMLAEPAGEVQRADALRWLDTSPAEPFDILFLDPPFAEPLLGPAADLLESHGWLAEDALIYVEQDAARSLPPLPASWELEKDKRAGQVAYRLYRRSGVVGQIP